MLGFRVWDTEQKKMISDRDTDYSFYMRDDGTCYFDADGYGPYENLIEFKKRYIPMQSTGLKDSNNVEIFEKDILINKSLYPYDPLYKLYAIEVSVFLWAGGYENFISMDNKTVPNYLIIGNSIENPELLERLK